MIGIVTIAVSGAWVAGGSLVVAGLALAWSIWQKLTDRAQAQRDRLAEERHGVVVERLDGVNRRIDETNATARAFHGEVSREIASLHRADAQLALDLERRVAPIEGKLGIGRAAERGRAEGGE